jgi:hypothetical protein
LSRWPLRPEAKYRRGLPAPRHARPATDRPWMSAGIHRWRWRLSLTSSLSRCACADGSLCPLLLKITSTWIFTPDRGCRIALRDSMSTPNRRPEHGWMSGSSDQIVGGMC